MSIRFPGPSSNVNFIAPMNLYAVKCNDAAVRFHINSHLHLPNRNYALFLLSHVSGAGWLLVLSGT